MLTGRRLLTSMTSILLFLGGCDTGSWERTDTGTDTTTIQAAHYRNLQKIYDTYEYDLEELEDGVPPLLLRRFPTDMHLIRPTRAKKDFFFKSVLPLALHGNQEILRQRRAVENFLATHDQGMELSLHQHEELLQIQKYYKVDGNVLTDKKARNRLLRRIDTVPPALILAQAANESGWGMSRFAQHANNIFGEWTFTPGTGLVPEDRPKGETYEVRRFKNLYASIRSYLRNLNTHSAYRSMRLKRQNLRKNGLPVTGYALAGEMRYYSIRRDAYVEEIREMIRGNDLEKLNQLTLLPSAELSAKAPARKRGGLMSTREKVSRRSRI